jgi:hypothetical protein
MAKATKEFVLMLDEPAYVKVSNSDGSYTAEIDIYAAMRMLGEADALNDESKRWTSIVNYLADELDCDQSTLAENVAIAFNDYVCAIVVALNDARKKKAESIAETFATNASSLTFTQVSPATSASGKPAKNKRGSKTSPA